MTETSPAPLTGTRIRRHDTVIAPGGRPFFSNITVTEYRANGSVRSQRMIQFWGNESSTLVRNSLGDTIEARSSFNLKNEPTQAKRSLWYLRNANYTTDSVVERDGHTSTTLVANESTNGGTLNVRAVVDERCLIHELTMSFVVIFHEAHPEFRIVETGPDPPEKPDWTANVTEWPPGNTTQNSSA